MPHSRYKSTLLQRQLEQHIVMVGYDRPARQLQHISSGALHSGGFFVSVPAYRTSERRKISRMEAIPMTRVIRVWDR